MARKPGIDELNRQLNQARYVSTTPGYSDALSKALRETYNYGMANDQNRLDVANTIVGGGGMTSLNRGDTSGWDWDNQKHVELDRVQSTKFFRDMGLFDTRDYATNKGYTHMASLGYLNSLLPTLQAEIEASQQTDRDMDLLKQQTAETSARWFDLMNADNETEMDRWYNMLMADYLLGDRNELFDFEAIDARYGDMSDEEYNREYQRLTDQWNDLDWETLTGGGSNNYQSKTAELQGYYNTVQGEVDRRTEMEALQGSIRGAADYGTLSAYTDTYVAPERGLFAGNAYEPYIQGYDDLSRFMNSSDTWASYQTAAEHSLAVRGYLDKGYDYLTADELADYNYLINAGRTEDAARYLELLGPELLYRRAMVMKEYQSVKATNPWLAAPTWVDAGIQQIENVFNLPVQIYETWTGQDNPYSAAWDAYNKSQWTSEAQIDWIQDADTAQWVKDTATFLYKGVSGARDNFTRLVASGFNPTGALILAGAQSTSGSLHESSQRDDMSAAAKIIKAIGTGAIEVGTEKIGLDALFDRGQKGALEYLLGSMGAEIGEETLNAMSEPVLEAVVAFLFDHEAEIMSGEDFWKNLTDTAITTALSSLFMSGGSAIQKDSANRKQGKNFQQNGDLETMLQIAENLGASNYNAKGKYTQSESAAKEIREIQKGGGKVSTRQLGKFITAVAHDLGTENANVLNTVYDDAITERLVELGEDEAAAKELAPAIRRMTQGEKIPLHERAAIKWTDSATQVFKELNTEVKESQNIVPGATQAEEGQRTGQAWKTAAEQKYAEAAAPIIDQQMLFNKALRNKDAHKAETPKQSATDKAVSTGAEMAKSGEGKFAEDAKPSAVSFTSDGGEKTGTVARFKKGKDGMMAIVEVAGVDGTTTKAEVVVEDIGATKDAGIGAVISHIADAESRGHDMSEQQASTMLHAYEQEGGDAKTFIDGFEDAYFAGYAGNELASVGISDGVARIAYEQGKAEAVTDESNRVARATRVRTDSNGEVSFIGKVKSSAEVKGKGDPNTLTAAMKHMTGSQRTTTQIVQAFAKKFKTNVVLFESDANSIGKLENGSYDPNTNTIYIDINSGADSVEGIKTNKKQNTLGYAMVRTLGHELTHHLESTSSEGYAAYKNAVKNALKDNGEDWAVLVRRKLDNAKLAGIKLTYAGAEAEVVADASEYILQNSKFVKEIDDETQGKIKKFIKNFMEKLRQVFQQVTGGHQESKAIREEIDGVIRYMGDIQKLWDAAMEESIGREASAEATGEQEAEAIELSDVNTQYSIREEAPPKKTGIAYKVFFEKNGKLYPPMVANPGGADTPVGVWLNADVGTAAPPSKTGRLQVKAGGKGTQGGSGSLAFRPGWHLGDIPKASQFNRLNKATGVKELFPYNFVWAECEYAMDVDYQEEAMSYGYNASGKFQHSLAGLPRLPVDGYYHYRTNPDPTTVPWVITGAMKVNKILSRAEVDEILRENGVEPTKWQGPDGEQMEADSEAKQFSLRDVDHSETVIQENMRLIQNMKPVSRLVGNEFQMGKTLKSDVKKYYDSIGGAANSPLFGRIILNKAAIKDSLGHGLGPVKAIMYHAVPNIISDGKMIDYHDNWKGRGYDTALIAAPVTIEEGEYKGDYWVGVILNLYADSTQRFYVHEPIVVQKRSVPVVQTGTPEGATPGNEDSSITSILDKLNEVKQEVEETDDETGSPDGIDIDEDTESAAPLQYSIRTWADSDYVTRRDEAAKRLADSIGVSVRKAKNWIDDVNSVSAYVLSNKARLDYIPTAVKGMSAFKSNPEYGGSIDMSTICAKRRLATGTLDAIQRVLGDAVLTKDDFLHIREIMKDRGYEVACGLCFVESSRKNLSKYNRQFLDQYRAEHPDVELGMVDLNTVEGLEKLRSNPDTADIYAAYEKFMNKLAQRKPKLFEKRTEYNHEILKKFKSDTSVGVKNTNGGLRLQSFSDFEIVHLLDMMQVITDMASVGLAGQAYTKVPDFAWALGDTGLKINLSLIAKDVDADGNLIFDDIEGMNHNEAKKLRDAYSKNVGTIVVTFTDEQTIAAMKSDFIDYIIPFHRSQWQKGDYKKLGLPEGTKDYTMHQNEKEGRKRVKENFLPNAYWDFSVSGKQNAINYLKMCADAGRTPKFAKFLENNGDGTYSLKADGSTDGYWKLLIDFKMYDNAGKGSPQLAVKPTFNMEQAMRMLEEYKGEHDTFPVAQDVVDDFVKEYRGDKGGVKAEDGRYTVNPIQHSLRDLPEEISTREFLTDADSSIAATVEERNALSIYQKLLKNHAEASETVMAAEDALERASETDKPEARKALTAARSKQKDLYNRLLNVERTAHVQSVVKRSQQIIGDLYGKNQAEVDKMVSALERKVETLRADLQGLKGAAKTQQEADIRAAERDLAAYKSKAAKALLANSEKYAKRMADLYERAELHTEIAKHQRHIKRIVKLLDDRIRHEEDYKNVKEPLKPAVHKLVTAFIDGFGNMVFDAKTADHLRRVYDEIAKDDGAPDFYSDDVANWLTDLAKLAEEDQARRSAGGSTLESVQWKLDTYSNVAEIADHIYKMVTAADEIFINGKRQSFAAISGEVGSGLVSLKDKALLVGKARDSVRALDDLLRTGNMTPTYFFQHLKNSGLTKLFDNMMDGQTKYAQSIREGQEAVAEAKRKYGFYGWQNMKQGVEFRTEQGHDISLTVPQMMWVYATAKREATNRLMDTHHLDQGGFRYEAKDLPRQKGKMTAIPGSDRLHKLSAEDVKKITDTLTAEQKACADELVGYLSNECAEQGNEASMEMFGIKKYNEEYYFPFKTASDQRYQRSDAGSASTTNDARVKHTSFTHSLRKGANTPLVMGDFFDVIADHINLMATYSSFVVPIESMNRVLNAKVNEDADGSGNDVTIRSLMARKYGEPAQKYVADLMKDLNGGPQTDNRGAVSALFRAFKRGAVMGSLSVALQQPTAIARAFAYVNPKYFAHITMEGNKKTWERMMKYSGTAVIKDMGKFDVGTGKMANDWIANSDLQDYNVWKRGKFLLHTEGWNAVKNNWVEWATALPGVMDRVTWTHIWKAIEAEQAEQNPGMDRNSDEFQRAVGQRFDDVINRTQVYDSILAKSQNMRSKNAFAQMSTAFMAEPTLNINMIYDAMANKHTAGERAGIITSVVTSSILAAAMASLIAAWNKDDDERKLSEKYLAEFASRAIDSVNPLTMIPYISDIWSMVNGYDIERTDLSVVKDVIDYTTSFISKAKDPEKVNTWRDYENFFGTIANLTGVPAKNWSRDVRRIRNLFVTDKSASSPAGLKYTLLENITPLGLYSDSNKAYCQRLVAAVVFGDTQEAYDLWDYLTNSKKVSQNSINTNVRDELKRRVQEGTITPSQATEILRKYAPYVNDKDNINKPKEWLNDK